MNRMETHQRQGSNREINTSPQSREEEGDEESLVQVDSQASTRDEDTAWSPPVVRKKKGGRKKGSQWLLKDGAWLL
ncbi:hypothetical protein OIU85_014381 [Salix viminalis]|uniref:Uncharacterized protein n=1 Tax=Salix viminalis TaxID=40686 RepID=A0A9Q0SB67_SALVM|nr:hypothetical protein OIU85_014381 [Salix viminalis]